MFEDLKQLSIDDLRALPVTGSDDLWKVPDLLRDEAAFYRYFPADRRKPDIGIAYTPIKNLPEHRRYDGNVGIIAYIQKNLPLAFATFSFERAKEKRGIGMNLTRMPWIIEENVAKEDSQLRGMLRSALMASVERIAGTYNLSWVRTKSHLSFSDKSKTRQEERYREIDLTALNSGFKYTENDKWLLLDLS